MLVPNGGNERQIYPSLDTVVTGSEVNVANGNTDADQPLSTDHLHRETDEEQTDLKENQIGDPNFGEFMLSQGPDASPFIPRQDYGILYGEFEPPRSLVAAKSDHSKRESFFSKCCNNFYDILTIVISIADIATDIIVLISYFKEDRMTFFWISLTILLVAQLGYLWLFDMTFNTTDFRYNLSDLGWRLCCCKGKPCKVTAPLRHRMWSCLCRPCTALLASNTCKSCLESAFYFTCMMFGLLVLIPCGIVSLTMAVAILLPLGHFVAFLMYFTDDEDSKFSKWLRDTVGIKRESNFFPEQAEWMSTMARTQIQKFNKLGGLILEAFLEALPQSILQLIAMVYYQETDVIAVGSIILSITSIMTKSLVISQGLEWKSYVWTWFCVFTDFFSIFFIVSWIFLSNDYIDREFLGIFNIFGEIWCWKVFITILVPLGLSLLFWFTFAFWFLLCEYWFDHWDSVTEKLFLSFTSLFCGNALLLLWYIIGAFLLTLITEVAAFSLLAYCLWWKTTAERWDYTEKKGSDQLKMILNFIGDANDKQNDRIVRILAVNYAYSVDSWNNRKLKTFIEARKKAEALDTVQYSDIRDNCSNPKKANIISTAIEKYPNVARDLWSERKYKYYRCYDLQDICDRIYVFVMCFGVYIGIPLYTLNRILSILYPYWICAYLTYHGLWNEMHLFEVVMLGSYIGLQMIILILGIFVFRTHWWLWHVVPGEDYVGHRDTILIKKSMNSFYDSVQWKPLVTEMVMDRFGRDIGLIVMDYVKAMNEISTEQESP